MKNIWLIIIIFFIILTIIELINQNPQWWNNKREGFITSFSGYVNLHKTKPLNIDNNLDNNINTSEMIINSSIPPNYIIGIENNNSIDIKIAQYFINNIIPAKIQLDNNNILIKKIEINNLDLAFVREYYLLRYIDKYNTNNNNSNIRVIMPTFNKYLIALTSSNNDIEYIEDINYFNNLQQNICYVNDDDIGLVKTIIKLQKLLPKFKNRINYVKINSLYELGPTDIFIGLIIPKERENEIQNNKLKPIFYLPTKRIPKRENRLLLNIKINEEDKNDIKEFHYDLKNYYDWLMETEVFLSVNNISYRTYKVRFLLICNSNSKLKNNNFKTLINNWWSHRIQLKNIYTIDNIHRNNPVINDSFTDLSAISPKLYFYNEMKIFLKNKRLLQYNN
jgi:hypothetical protein